MCAPHIDILQTPSLRESHGSAVQPDFETAGHQGGCEGGSANQGLDQGPAQHFEEGAGGAGHVAGQLHHHWESKEVWRR